MLLWCWKVFDMLDKSERDELCYRLGYLNVCDGSHPDMVYSLDLSVYEDKRACEVRR